jgi:hypothetical protein
VFEPLLLDDTTIGKRRIICEGCVGRRNVILVLQVLAIDGRSSEANYHMTIFVPKLYRYRDHAETRFVAFEQTARIKFFCENDRLWKRQLRFD